MFSVSESAVVPTAGSLHEAASPTEATASTFFFLPLSSFFFLFETFFFSLFFIFSQRDEQGVRNGGAGSEGVVVYQSDERVKHYEHTGLLVARASQRTKGEN